MRIEPEKPGKEASMPKNSVAGGVFIIVLIIFVAWYWFFFLNHPPEEKPANGQDSEEVQREG